MIRALLFFSSISFLFYGSGCFFSRYLAGEFQRYGFAPYRKLIGSLQILGAIGLLAGLHIPLAGKAASGGLALMMVVAILVRIRIRDSFLQTLPALLYLVVNGYLLIFGF